MSLVLRHQPALAGLVLDAAGWTSVDALLRGAAAAGTPFTREELDEIVRTSDKQRYALCPEGDRIRANQGHTVEVDLGYALGEPPECLFHGTVERFLAAIREQGLLRGARHHVHLSAARETAVNVGQRRGKPIVLEIGARQMAAEGHEFFLSANGVWLTAAVPPRYIVP